MKKMIILLLFFNLTAYSQEISRDFFVGKWYYESSEIRDSIPDLQFTIKLDRVKENQVIGWYCAIAYFGNRIDCGVNEINITGYFQNDTLYLTFDSFYGPKGGKATITKISSNRIKWEIIKYPESRNGSVDCFAPNEAALKKFIEMSTEKKTKKELDDYLKSIGVLPSEVNK